MTSLWDDAYRPVPWAQRAQRLATSSAAVAELIAVLAADPQTAGRLRDVHRASSFDQAASFFLAATWTETDLPVLVKLNVTPWEQHWMLALGRHAPDLVPQVVASGAQLGGYAVPWLVLEHVPYTLLNDGWGDRRFDLLAEAAVRFQVAAQGIDRRFTGIEGLDSTRGWIERGLQAGCPGPIARVLERLNRTWDWVAQTCSLEVCVGDLTPVNALSRTPPPGGDTALLIDPIPRVAPWAWDGAYCQCIAATTDVRMVQRMAASRRRRGLYTPADADLDRLATLMLAWLGALWWGIMPSRHDAGPWRDQIERYVESAAALDLGTHDR